MVDGLRTFDPVGAFQGARRQQQAIAAEEAAVPRRNELFNLKQQQAQQTLGATRTRQEQQATTFEQQQALGQIKFGGQVSQALRSIPLEQRRAAVVALGPQFQKFGLNPGDLTDNDLTNAELDADIAQFQAFQGQQTAPVSDLDVARAEKLRAETAQIGAPVAAPVAAPPAVIPPSLIVDLPEALAKQVSDVFTTAGGGTKGLEAAAKAIDKGSEQQRRLSSPKIIQTSFPKASPAELIQLQSTMDAAKTTESGLKEAGKIRTEQRRLKKAQVFQNRAVELLNNILENPELNDILGSVEGTDEGFVFGEKIRSDREAEGIADIKEVESLLTAENLDLMSGVLSETDIKILTQLASGALIRTRREERFTKDVTTLRDRLSKQLVQTADDTAADRGQQAGQGPQEGDTAFNRQTQQRIVFRNGQWQPI